MWRYLSESRRSWLYEIYNSRAWAQFNCLSARRRAKRKLRSRIIVRTYARSDKLIWDKLHVMVIDFKREKERSIHGNRTDMQSRWFWLKLYREKELYIKNYRTRILCENSKLCHPLKFHGGVSMYISLKEIYATHGVKSRKFCANSHAIDVTQPRNDFCNARWIYFVREAERSRSHLIRKRNVIN